jgi:hypothetical protein
VYAYESGKTGEGYQEQPNKHPRRWFSGLMRRPGWPTKRQVAAIAAATGLSLAAALALYFHVYGAPKGWAPTWEKKTPTTSEERTPPEGNTPAPGAYGPGGYRQIWEPAAPLQPFGGSLLRERPDDACAETPKRGAHGDSEVGRESGDYEVHIEESAPHARTPRTRKRGEGRGAFSRQVKPGRRGPAFVHAWDSKRGGP